MSSLFNFRNIKHLLQGNIPGQLIIQYTDSCNATCPQCGMRKTAAYSRSKLSKDTLYQIIDSAAQQQIQSLSFTGGEPFIYKDELIDLINYASNKKIPLIRTGTNGFMFTDPSNANFKDKIHRFADELSKTNLRNFWISIDSADMETHEQMRGLPGVIKGIEKALPIFHQHGIYPAANLGINRNTGGVGNIAMKMTDQGEFYTQFKESFEAFYRFVIKLGFTMTNVCYPMSVTEDQDVSPVYGATSVNSVISFTAEEKIQIFKALSDTIPKFRPHIRIFTPLVSLYSLIKYFEGDREFSLPCRGGIDFFFIDAQSGNTYPCGYRGKENLGKFYELDRKKLETKASCKLCDWECFRDPSEMIGYPLALLKNPLKSGIKKDADYKRLWWQDLKYYKACDFFDGRKPHRQGEINA